MNRIFNFSAGPANLPLSVLEEAQRQLVDFNGKGMSIIEMSHRSKDYDQVHMEAMSLFKELLGLSDDFKVMFLGGGATLQFTMIPMNFLGGKPCDLTLTGSWAKAAYKDAKKLGKVNLAWDGTSENFTRMPKPAELKLDPEAAYLHLTSNETIGGIQWHEWPDSSAPVIVDMSSDFLSRPLPVEKFAMMYAGAQKNIGPAGLAVAIVRQELIDRAPESLTAYLSYKTHAEKDSLYNTPPVFPIYITNLVLKWVKANGGLKGMEELADLRSGKLYDMIDNSDGYYWSPVGEDCRSKMNVVFRLKSEDLEKKFLAEAGALGLSGLKGHRSVGGCRASIYNAMPVEGVTTLIDFMKKFAQENK